jgi:hypothetical protein
VQLDDLFQPRRSLHSRADGVTHGVTAVAEYRHQLFVAARGDGVVVSIPFEDRGYGMTPVLELRNGTRNTAALPP